MSWLHEMILPVQDMKFRLGDAVVVVEGTFQCTPGVFLNLKADTNWAEIKEYDGIVRSHPVIWLRHSRSFQREVTGTVSSERRRRLPECQ